MRVSKRKALLTLWGMPLLLSAITLLGLLLAIIGTGIWHGLSWVALSVPVYFMVKYGMAFFSAKKGMP